jgi:broad specificity phosphatase PhoE
VTTRLLLVRHGETESNRRGLALGRADVPMNDVGKEQASRLAEALRNEPITAVYASPLSRTRETAGGIGDALGLGVQIEDSLIEMDVGELDGLEFADVRERYPGFIETWLSQDGPDHPMPGGESLRDVRDRAWRFVEGTAEAHGGETVCVVTHNFVILTVLASALGSDLGSFRRLRHGVAAISVLEWDGKVWRVAKMNDTCHLD